MVNKMSPPRTDSPTRQRSSVTVPSAGATSVCIIFIASMISKASPARTRAPTVVGTADTSPGMGARSVLPAAALAAAVPASACAVRSTRVKAWMP